MRPESAMRGLELLVIQPTPFCNLDCDYCYLAERSVTGRMAPAVLRRTIEQVLASGFVEDEFTIVWHAGEPLVVPVDYYEQAFAIVRELVAPTRVRVYHALQTNGTLINRAWCEWIHRHHVRVGVSVDGPAFIHDAHRKTRSGKGTHARVMQGIRCLQEHDVDFHVISVLTREALDHPEEMFAFFVSNRLRRVGFNIEEIEGLNQASTLSSGEAEARLREFITQFADLVDRHPGSLEVREFRGLEQFITRRRDALERNQENTALSIISVGWTGEFSTFSPELLSVSDSAYGGFSLGNVLRDDLATITRTPRFIRMKTDVDEGIARCRRSCEYFPLCGGGSPSNKYFEAGSFRGTETLHCRLAKKVIADVTLERLEARLGLSVTGQIH